MKITTISSGYWQKYKKLRIESLLDSPQSFLETPQEAESKAQKDWQKRLENMFFAIDEKENLLGMIGFYFEDKQKLNHILNIVSFYVSPNYRKQGIGSKLFSKVLDFARSQKHIKKLQLGVITTQKPAFNLYKSFGFQKIGIQKMAVKVDDKFYDEYLMELYL